MEEKKTLTEEETRAFYAEWLEQPEWNFNVSLRLLACPPCLEWEDCIRANMPKGQKKTLPPPKERLWWYPTDEEIGREAAQRERIAQHNREVVAENRWKDKFLSEHPCLLAMNANKLGKLILLAIRTKLFLYDGDGLQSLWRPLDFIKWAWEEPGVTVPQPLADWYDEQMTKRRAIKRTTEVTAALAAPMQAAPKASPEEETSISATDGRPQKLPVLVNISLWVGQSAEVAYKILKNKYDDLDLIALILHDTCNDTKQEKSRLLMSSQLDEKSRVKQFNRMLKRAKKRYKTTYIE